MSVSDAKKRKMALEAKKIREKELDEIAYNDPLSSDILKELKKQTIKMEQIRFNLNNLTFWYLYIGLTIAAIVFIFSIIGIISSL